MLQTCHISSPLHHLRFVDRKLHTEFVTEGGRDGERERGWESESTVMSHFVKLFNRHIVTLFKGETVVYYNEPTHHINLSLCCTHHSSVKSIGKPN